MVDQDEIEPADLGINPEVSRRIFLGMIAFAGAFALALWALKPAAEPPPSEIANDPALVAGRTIYLANCANCHGETGRGDGPLSKTLAGPAPRDFTDEWKYGEKAEEALDLVAKGAPDSAMPGWRSALSPGDLKAVVAYVYHLGGKPIPPSLH